jgi:hypothetical protein
MHVPISGVRCSKLVFLAGNNLAQRVTHMLSCIVLVFALIPSSVFYLEDYAFLMAACIVGYFCLSCLHLLSDYCVVVGSDAFLLPKPALTFFEIFRNTQHKQTSD